MTTKIVISLSRIREGDCSKPHYNTKLIILSTERNCRHIWSDVLDDREKLSPNGGKENQSPGGASVGGVLISLSMALSS